jgi:hypothetical protein
VRAALRQASYPPPADEPVTVDTDKDQRRHDGLVLAQWRGLRLGWWRFETD